MFITKNHVIASIKRLNKHYNIDHYKLLIKYFKEKTIAYKLEENDNLLNGIIIYLIYNKHHVGLLLNTPPPNDVYYRLVNLGKTEVKNLLYCLSTNDFKKKKKSDIKLLKTNKVYFCISNKKIDYQIIPTTHSIATYTQLFGIENINILKYINYDRVLKFKTTKEGKHSISELSKYKKLIEKHPDYITNCYNIWSSLVLFMIGTTTAMDVDIMIYNTMDNKTLNRLSKELYKDIDAVILNKDRTWYCVKTDEYKYWMSYAISEEWVKEVGANNIENVFFNSKYCFYMYGIKFISLELQIEKLIKRNSASSYADLLSIKQFNNPKLEIKCVSKLRFRVGSTTIINDNEYSKLLDTIKYYMKEWHNVNYPIVELKKILPLCKEEAYNKYLVKINTKNLFNNLRTYHQYIKELYIGKHCSKCNMLLDVGSAHLKSLRFWKKLGVKNIIAIEPSEDLYKIGISRQQKNTFAKEHITYIRGVGEKNLESGEAGLNSKSKELFKSIKNVNANCITFEFTIHYMLYNIDVLLTNIIRFCARNTKVIIHCLNGDIIESLLSDKKKHNITLNKDVVFYVEKMYKNTDEHKKINVYFKGTQGLDNVVSEYIVTPKDIIDTFVKNGFELTEFTKFQEHKPHQYNLSEYELKVSMLYVTYVFNYSK